MPAREACAWRSCFTHCDRATARMPLDALVWLANHRSRRGDGLEAGQIVSTGSLTGIHWIRPGAHVVAEYPGLGQVEVVLDP